MSGVRLLLASDAVGGVWTYSIELARALRHLGAETVIAAMGPSPSRQQLEDAAGIGVIDTGLPLDWLAESPADIRRAGRALAALATGEGVDLVQLGSAALLADVEFEQPVVAVQHSCVATWWDAVRSGPLPRDFACRRDLVEDGLNRASAVAAPTAAFAAHTARCYDLGRPVYAVHNGCTPHPLPSRSRRDFAFTVGRLWDDAKNPRTLDEAAAQLDVAIEAIGPLAGPNGTVVSFDNLQTPGQLSRADIAERLAAHPVFASAALYEPFGLAALEAAQAGCALVLSDISTHRELWEGAALFAPADDPSAFAAAIGKLMNDRDEREGLGRAAQLRALDYTPAAMARRMHALYVDLLSARAAPIPVIELAGAA